MTPDDSMPEDFTVSSSPRRRSPRRKKPPQNSIMWQVCFGIVLANLILVGGCYATLGVGGCAMISVIDQAARKEWAGEARRREALYRQGGTDAELCGIAGEAAEAWGLAGDKRKMNLWLQRANEHKRKAEGRIR